VAAGDPATAAAAVEALRAGGNAYDAAVAAVFAAAVAEPTLSSLGGGGFLLARTADGTATVVDFFVDTPGRGLGEAAPEPHFTPVTVRFSGAEQVFHVGYGSAGVPGTLAGLLHVHRTLGRLDLAAVVAPARALASAGAVISGVQAEIIRLLADILTLTAEGRAVFAPDGHLPRAGDRLTNHAYADFLADVAAGRVTGFADPPLAAATGSMMQAHHGLLGPADLEAYRVVERAPLEVHVRGCRVLTNPPPAFGGGLVAHGLELLDAGADLGRALMAISDRDLIAQVRSVKGTTHVSVADADGNVAAMTTSNGSCSGVFVPGTGVQLNNVMGEQDLHPDGFHAAPPGLRVGSMMSPTVVELPDGRVVALGSGGSERIRSSITQVVTRLIDGAHVADAVRAPRLHWDGQAFQAEPGLDHEVLRALTVGRHVNVWPSRDLYFGGVNAVVTGAGAAEAAGDDRRDGAAHVLDPPAG
jgi:gamma-glutamyltranspeptidase/glutathione hydrolase